MDEHNASGVARNLTRATPSIIMVFCGYIVTGFLMFSLNLLFILLIILNKRLRRRELLMIGGLAFADFYNGIGIFYGGIKRLTLALNGLHFSLVTPWECMKYFQTTFFIGGSTAAGFMLVMVSVDRFLAIQYFSLYATLTNRYTYTVLAVVYSYVFLSLPVVTMISYYLSDPTKKVAAVCISTQVGPHWFATYQPTIQMGCGILSVIVFIVAYVCYVRQMHAFHQDVQDQYMKEQRQMTLTVGITVALTFLLYVLPHGMIWIFNTFGLAAVASQVSPYGFVLSNFNSIVNIFIFGIFHPIVRATVKKYLKRCCSHATPVVNLN